MKPIDGDRLLKWLKKERDRIEQDRDNWPAELRSHMVGGLIELCYVIDHIERVVNRGGANGKKD